MHHYLALKTLERVIHFFPTRNLAQGFVLKVLYSLTSSYYMVTIKVP